MDLAIWFFRFPKYSQIYGICSFFVPKNVMSGCDWIPPPLTSGWCAKTSPHYVVIQGKNTFHIYYIYVIIKEP